MIRNILCIGAGYVGGPTMALIADRCPDVRLTVVDINPDKIAQWNSARLPVFEPGLEEVVRRVRGRNLTFAPITPEAIAAADLIFICVNTPTKEYGEGAGMASDLQYWEQSTRTILAHAKPGTIVVEKSTVPVRTAEAVSRILNFERGGTHFQVLSNPEFLAEGTAVRDLEAPDRVLIGSERSEAGQAAARELGWVYEHWVPKERILYTSVWSSELSKLAANAFLAQRISSINSLSAVCERTDADITEISRAVGMDPRIGARFLEAGIGFGGSCFRKDIQSLAYLCREAGLAEVAEYWLSVVRMNDYQVARFVKAILDSLFNTVADKKLAIFGFAFKPETNDTRDAPALQVCLRLLQEQARLAVTDPQALDNARRDLSGLPGNAGERVSYEPDPYRAASGAHALVLLTQWRQFKALDYERIYAGMHKPAFVFDGRNLLDHEELFRLGFNVVPIGKAPRLHF
jgi:UDPglucose 6-dehydrogenase